MNIFITLLVSATLAADPGYQALVDAANVRTEEVHDDRFICQVTDDPDEIAIVPNRVRVRIWNRLPSNAYAVQLLAIVGRTYDGVDVNIRGKDIRVLHEWGGHEMPSIALLQEANDEIEESGAVLSASHTKKDEYCIGFLPRGEYRAHFRLIRLYLGEHTGNIPLFVPAPPKSGFELVDTRRYSKMNRWFTHHKVVGPTADIHLLYSTFAEPPVVPVPIQR